MKRCNVKILRIYLPFIFKIDKRIMKKYKHILEIIIENGENL
jgi:hypothetical protein